MCTAAVAAGCVAASRLCGGRLLQLLHAAFQGPIVYSYLFIHFSSFKPDTENNANFDVVSSKRANFDEVQFFKTYT